MAPPKPWEGAATGGTGGGPSSVSPLGASTAADGQLKPWDAAAVGEGTIATGAADSRTLPARPWERQGVTQNAYASTSYGQGAYGGGMYAGNGGMYGTGYGAAGGAGTYGSMYGRPGGLYGGMYGANAGYGGYGASSGYGGMYGGGLGGGYNTGYGGGYARGMYGGGGPGGMYGSGMYGPARPGLPPPPGGEHDSGPPRAPAAWEALLSGFHAIVHVFGRVACLVDENTFAMHMFIDALLQLLDRAGALYGEIARFVLRLLGWRPRSRGEARKGGSPPSKSADGSAVQPADATSAAASKAAPIAKTESLDSAFGDGSVSRAQQQQQHRMPRARGLPGAPLQDGWESMWGNAGG